MKYFRFYIYLFSFTFCFVFQNKLLAQNSTIDSLKQLLENAKEDTNKVNILYQLSITVDRTNNYSKTISYAEQAKMLSEKIGFKNGIIKAIRIIALKYYGGCDYPKALETFFKLLKIQEENNDEKAIAAALNYIGLIYTAQSAYPKALEFYFKSLRTMEKIGNQNGIAAVQNNIAEIYERQENYPKALENYLKSLEISQKIGSKYGISNTLTNIGNIYYKQKDYPQALQYAFKGLKIHEEIVNKIGMAAGLINIGNIYRDKENYFEALVYYNKALKIQEDINDKNEIVDVLNGIGLVYLRQNQTKEALVYFEKSLLTAQKIGCLDGVMQAQKSLSDIYEQMGNVNKSLAYYKQYIVTRDSIYNKENTQKLVREEMNFEFEKKQAVEKVEQEKREAIVVAEINKQKILRNTFIAGLIAALLLAYVMFNRYNVKQKLNTELSEKNKIIDSQKQKIVSSINYAKGIQQSILVEESEVQKLLPDSFIYYQPKDIVSGDFYWVSSVNEKIIIAAIDCTGHGVPGAFMSMIGNTLLNQIVNEKQVTSPAEILTLLHKNIYASLHQQKNNDQSQDGMDVALCTIDINAREIQYAGARNPLYVIQNNNVDIFKANNYSVGGTEFFKIEKSKEREYSNDTIPIQNGMCIYLFSDGYMDQFGGESDKKFGSQRFKDLLLANHQLDMSKQKTVVSNAIQKWKGNSAQIDDILVIGIRL